MIIGEKPKVWRGLFKGRIRSIALSGLGLFVVGWLSIANAYEIKPINQFTYVRHNRITGITQFCTGAECEPVRQAQEVSTASASSTESSFDFAASDPDSADMSWMDAVADALAVGRAMETQESEQETADPDGRMASLDELAALAERTKTDSETTSDVQP